MLAAVHVDPYIVLGSAVVGLLVGMTGAGGGALMTPMLILLFGVTPSKAISSDLVAAVLMRPLGAGVHMRARTVNFGLVRWLVVGSVPAAFLGAYIGNRTSVMTEVETALGAALLVGAGAMALRFALDRRAGQGRTMSVHEVLARPFATVAVGVVGGLIVGMTSVGSGSLMIVLLLFLYPAIGADAAGRHRPHAGGAADGRGGARPARLRPRRVRRDGVAGDRERAGRGRRLAALLERCPTATCGRRSRS